MSESRRPPVVHGAFVHQPETGASRTCVVFRYDPESLRRTAARQIVGEAHDRSGSVRFTGAPIETITLDIEIDAIDASMQVQPHAASGGVAPQLAALDLLAFPAFDDIRRRHQELSGGTLDLVAGSGPMLYFVFGAKRVLPVSIDSLQITEEDFDEHLNPIRATAVVTMRVLADSDVVIDVAASEGVLSSHRFLERLATELVENAMPGVSPSAVEPGFETPGV